jgi:inorganic pyrophosphatase
VTVADGSIEVVIETPRGSRNKLKFDADRGRFRLSHVLPEGMSFPYDFGFVPDTQAQDGDPLDVLVLTDAGLPMGCSLDVRLIGVLEAEQRERDGKVVRNDRLIGVAEESTTHQEVRDLDDLGGSLVDEIEAFFEQYNRLNEKAFHVLHRRGASAAVAAVRKAMTDADGTEGGVSRPSGSSSTSPS